MAARSETIAMRDGEKIAAGALADYLRGKIDGAGRRRAHSSSFPTAIPT